MHFYDLCFEYLLPKILSDLTREIEVALRIDKAILSGNFGHYARVLIDVDLVAKLLHALILDLEDSCSQFSLDHLKLPLFCSTCWSICHDFANCNLFGQKQC